MDGITTLIAPDRRNFSELGYLAANPDVAAAVRHGQLKSGHDHFWGIGYTESRSMVQYEKILAARPAKIARIARHVDWPVTPPFLDNGGLNCLPDSLARMAGVEPTDAVSQHDYIDEIKNLITSEPGRLFLDAGAGFRPTYYANVINLEIVPYATTDVLAVLEMIPFANDTFDYVISNAVLEHVRDPFTAAREILRVLKPGGRLYIQVPFLQPYHGYPHHYYNMTKSGLANLFTDEIDVLSHTVPLYFHPVWVAQWFFSSWAGGLSDTARAQMERTTVKELMDFKLQEMDAPFVAELSEDKQFELASGTYLVGQKRPAHEKPEYQDTSTYAFLSGPMRTAIRNTPCSQA